MNRRTFLHLGGVGAGSIGFAAQSERPSPRLFPEAVPPTAYQDGTARVNAMLSSALNVTIPAGVYMITRPLNVRDGHVIAAASGTEVILKTAPSYGGQIVSTNGASFTLRGLTFDGAYADRRASEGATSATLVQVSGGTNVTLENNRFQYGPSFGLWIYRSAQMQIRGNTFLECYHPIRMDGANLQSGVIENNTFHNTSAFASIQHIEAIGTVNLAVRGNTMRGAGLAEPTRHGYEGTWGNAIYIWNSTGYLVEFNTVHPNQWSALVSGAGATRGVIRNNYLSDGMACLTSVWIEQPGAMFIMVDNNEIDGALEVGDSGGNHLTITNNSIRSRSFGINVNSAAKNVLIKGNRISSKAGYRYNNGLYLWQKTTPDVDVQVVNNTIQGFDNGIAINNAFAVGTVYGIRMKDNTFTDNNRNVWVPSAITVVPPPGL